MFTTITASLFHSINPPPPPPLRPSQIYVENIPDRLGNWQKKASNSPVYHRPPPAIFFHLVEMISNPKIARSSWDRLKTISILFGSSLISLPLLSRRLSLAVHLGFDELSTALTDLGGIATRKGNGVSGVER